jgi:tetratricopeptide (TPR) repeat protein
MEDNKPFNTSIVPSGINTLSKISTTIQITNKLLSERSENYFNKGFYLLNSNDLTDNTEDFYFKILNNPQYLKEKNFRFRSFDNFKIALELFTKAIYLNSSFFLALWARGKVFERSDYEKAISDFTKAIEIEPNFAYGYFSRGLAKRSPFAKFVYGDKEAIVDFTKALEIDPEFASAYFHRGTARYNSSMLINKDGKVFVEENEALSDYTKCIEIEPNFPNAYINRGQIRAGLKDYYGAIADFNKALENDPENKHLYLYRGEAKKKAGDIIGGEEDISKFNSSVK